MNNYISTCVKQRQLFERYHDWYNGVMAPHSNVCYETFRRIFKGETRVLKLVRPVHSTNDIKQILYKEIRRLTARKRIAWHKYQNNLRFNLFCISVYRKTRVDVSFARHKILEYLHGEPTTPIKAK